MLGSTGIVYSPGTIEFRYLTLHHAVSLSYERPLMISIARSVTDLLIATVIHISGKQASEAYITDTEKRLNNAIITSRPFEVPKQNTESTNYTRKVPDSDKVKFLELLNSGKKFKGIGDIVKAVAGLSDAIRENTSSMDNIQNKKQ